MRSIKLFIFDIDNTITTGPSIWELMHELCGTWKTHGEPYWELFLAGQFDFDTFCRLDVACWKGHPEETLEKAIQQIQYRPGFAELMTKLKEKNISSAIVSGTVKYFADYLARKHSIAHVFANPVNLDKGTIEINVPGNGKGLIVEKLLRKLGLSRHEVAVVGDSHFDLAMFDHIEHTFIMANEKYKEHSKYFVKDFFEILKKI
jgi:phosphoserine phosphatase